MGAEQTQGNFRSIDVPLGDRGQRMQEFTVDVSAVRSWEEFVAAFNEGFIRQSRRRMDRYLDSFNDYLWWPDEHPFRLVVRGWQTCNLEGNFHNTWAGRPVLDVVAEILRDNPQASDVMIDD